MTAEDKNRLKEYTDIAKYLEECGIKSVYVYTNTLFEPRIVVRYQSDEDIFTINEFFKFFDNFKRKLRSKKLKSILE